MRVNREKLLAQLEAVQAGLSTRDIVEQSSCFVFQDNEVLTFNDEIGCRHETDLDITGAVPAGQLLALLRKLPEDEIDVEVQDNELAVIGRRRKRQAYLRMEAEVLLPINAMEKPKKWKKLPEEFGECVDMAQQCAGTDQREFAITCVHIHPEFLEAADNFQIIRFNMAIGVKSSVLVRRDSIKHIVPLDMTEFSETETWMHFRNPAGLILSCRRFVEDYPNWTKFLKGTGTPMSLPKGLGDETDIADIFSSESQDQNEVLVELRPGKLRVKGTGITGRYSGIKKLNYKGDPMTFLISPKLLIELTKRHNECEITEEKLIVDGGKFRFVTCLGHNDEPDEDPEVEAEEEDE